MIREQRKNIRLKSCIGLITEIKISRSIDFDGIVSFQVNLSINAVRINNRKRYNDVYNKYISIADNIVFAKLFSKYECI